MPLYNFYSADGSREMDPEGVELVDEDAARHHAVVFAGSVLKDEPDIIRAKGQWRVEVTDDDNSLLFTVATLAIDAPRPAHA